MIDTLSALETYVQATRKQIRQIQTAGWPERANLDTLCAQMWKEFTPHAISRLGVPDVLKHLAKCLEPSDEEDRDETDGATD